MPRVVKTRLQEISWIYLRGLWRNTSREQIGNPQDYTRIQRGDISARKLQSIMQKVS